jgi:hypothetical protein
MLPSKLDNHRRIRKTQLEEWLTPNEELSMSAATRTAHRTVAWSKDDPLGAEIAKVAFLDDGMRARGVAIGSAPEPYRLDYELETGEDLVTARLFVHAEGDGWSRRLELRRERRTGWTAEVSQEGDCLLPDAGGDLSGFADALDPDLGLSPLFNTMPVLRHRIHEGGGPEDFVMVWISVPDLSLHPSPQRYTHLETRSPEERVIRFEAVDEVEDPFVADVVFDADGLVVDYPGIATRIRSATS